MSKVFNNKGIKAGCIYRIALENFVTYKRVELFPGPSLNLIIGPNGTGKSTFVCAIILGLCGKTSAIGRAKKISEFVRSGCENSTIEIELYRNNGERNVIITRNFTLEDVSTWSINHKTVREKQVQELITSMNIQVDNLCQLLPQDRVQDFSKMDAQQLLRSTLSAVGGQESVTQLDELIECRTKQKGNASSVQKNTERLQEEQRLNERLKVMIDALQQRKQIEKEIEVCEVKKLWMEYQGLLEQLKEYSNDKKEAIKIVNTHKSKLEPYQKVIDKAKVEVKTVEQEKLAASKKIFALKDNAKEIIATVRAYEYRIKEVEGSYQEKIEKHRNRERELQEAKIKLDKLTLDKRRLVEAVGDETKVNMEIGEIRKSLSKTNTAIDSLKKQKLDLQYELDNNIKPHVRLCENRIRNLEDVHVKRMETLRNYNEDCYNAVMWLRDNKNLFEHEVHEPMMLEINFTDPKFARYLETTIADRDLVAFTFESSKDMNLFLQKVRQEMGLRRVNAICSQGGPMQLAPRNIQPYKYLGFYTYLVDTITAPDAILRYLCNNYGIHKIPIGNDHTYNNSGKVPTNITNFYTENHRFVVRVSSYSGEKSSSTTEIRPAKLLANIADHEQIEKLKTESKKFKKTAEVQEQKIIEVDTKLATLETHLNNFNTRRKEINDRIEKVRTISAQIRIQAKKVQDIETEATFDIEHEKEKTRLRQKDYVLKQCKLHCELKEVVAKLQIDILGGDVINTKLTTYRNSIVEQESQLRQIKDELRTVEETLENIQSLYNRTKTNAKEKLMEAKGKSNNKLPSDADFPYKGKFDNLPHDVVTLEEHCYELQTRIDCMDQTDEQVFKEYEEREKLITRLKSEVNNSSDANNLLARKLETIRSKWLPPLEKLLQDIDRSFGDMFSTLGCAGEIKLKKGECADNFEEYGISILVRFREAEQLQVLTRHAQSGGERALSTAVYLMALQRLTTVPFRCVDEINQGMDAINERKMFELLVKVTTECDNAQYFLLTPKLLLKLQYNEKVMVHTIMNGSQIMDYKKWNYNSFLESTRKLKI